MSLPPLPEPGLVCNLSVYYGIAVNKTVLDPLFGTDQMREYGALCRKMALEEAENKCRVISNKYAFGQWIDYWVNRGAATHLRLICSPPRAPCQRV